MADSYQLHGAFSSIGESMMDMNNQQSLRQNVVSSFHSIKLSVEVIRESADHDEIEKFLDCIADEMARVEALLDGVFADAKPTPPTPMSAYKFIPLND